MWKRDREHGVAGQYEGHGLILNWNGDSSQRSSTNSIDTYTLKHEQKGFCRTVVCPETVTYTSTCFSCDYNVASQLSIHRLPWRWRSMCTKQTSLFLHLSSILFVSQGFFPHCITNICDYYTDIFSLPGLFHVIITFRWNRNIFLLKLQKVHFIWIAFKP